MSPQKATRAASSDLTGMRLPWQSPVLEARSGLVGASELLGLRDDTHADEVPGSSLI